MREIVIEDIIKRVKKSIIGRLADNPELGNTALMLKAVEAGGDGDYLEIGVLFGGSLIAAALLKNALGQKGKCVGIDPLNGYYVERRSADTNRDILTKKPVTPETLQKNLRKFGVEDRCEVIQANSFPLPVKGKFAVTYIDGDHWGDAPLRDWQSVKDITTKFVVFDNFGEEHPDVIEACLIAEQDPEWERLLVNGITFILKRIDDETVASG